MCVFFIYSRAWGKFVVFKYKSKNILSEGLGVEIREIRRTGKWRKEWKNIFLFNDGEEQGIANEQGKDDRSFLGWCDLIILHSESFLFLHLIVVQCLSHDGDAASAELNEWRERLAFKWFFKFAQYLLLVVCCLAVYEHTEILKIHHRSTTLSGVKVSTMAAKTLIVWAQKLENDNKWKKK